MYAFKSFYVAYFNCEETIENLKNYVLVMYSELLGSLTLCETASVTGSVVSTGVVLAVASGQPLYLVAISVCDRV